MKTVTVQAHFQNGRSKPITLDVRGGVHGLRCVLDGSRPIKVVIPKDVEISENLRHESLYTIHPTKKLGTGIVYE